MKIINNSRTTTTTTLITEEVDNNDDEKKKISIDDQKRSQRRIVQVLLWKIFLYSFFIGCFIFGLYCTLVYLRSIVLYWNKIEETWDLVYPGLFHKDRLDSTIAMCIHLIGASYLMIFGMLQYLPWLRRNRRNNFIINFHRWNGRLSIISCIFASSGGTYYAWSVGLVETSITGEQLNYSNYGFGFCFFICGIMIYYHGGITKNISKHKLWAYRLAGLFFSNIFSRLYLLVVFMTLSEDVHPTTLKWILTPLIWLFYIPFLIIADIIWRREEEEKKEKEKEEEQQLVTVGKAAATTTMMMTTTSSSKKEQPSSSSKTKTSKTSSSFGILVIIAKTGLLVVFIVTLTMQSLFVWIPAITEDFSDL